MKKFLAFLVTLALLATAVVVYVQVKDEKVAAPVAAAADAGKTVTFVHPEWVDSVTFEKDGRIHRSSGDWATVTETKDGVLTIAWDNWGVEQYKTTDGDLYELVVE